MEAKVSTTDKHQSLHAALTESNPSVDVTRDQWGNSFFWVKLDNADQLPDAAALLARFEARLCTVTAMSHVLEADPSIFIDYHFDVHGATVSVMTPLDPETKRVPTITPWFLNADWNEREAAELYGITVDGNNNPDRLFLDESIDQGILDQIIPLSTMMNGASTIDLWEHVMTMNKNEADPQQTPGSDDPVKEVQA